VSSPGSWNSELGPQHLEVGMLHSNFGGQNLTSCRATQASHLDLMFCKTTSVPSKAMSRQHLLLSSNKSQLQIFICRVPGPRIQNSDLSTRKSVCFTRISVVRSGCLIGQHKPCTQYSMFCKTTYATSKAMLREHLLSSEKSHLWLAI
jgi:hypothetical protein